MGKFNFKNEEDFWRIKNEAEEFYKTIGDVNCPYFKEKIAFNTKGLKHLKFKSNRQARPRKDQYSRLRLIRLVPEVLKRSHTLQGIWQKRRFEAQKMNSRWEQVMKDVTYYEFIAVIDIVRVKVIVKQVLNGEKHFWSVIPFWGIDKTTSKRILHSGDIEND
jgi:hypothetical protein